MGLMDTLLDQEISEIADLPTYEVPPKGFYKLLIKKTEEKELKLKDGVFPSLSVQYAVVEALELSNPADADKVKTGNEFNELYLFKNDPQKTKEAIKTAFKGVGEKLGIGNLGAIVAKLEGMEVYAMVGQRKDKDDPEKVYANVTNVVPT